MKKSKIFLYLILFLIITSLLYVYYIYSEPNIIIKWNFNHSENIKNNISYLENIPVVKIKWSGYISWFEHWKLLKQEIKDIVDILNYKILNKNSIKWFLLKTYLLKEAKELYKNIPQIYREEMKWVSDWAWVSYNDILLINTYDDLLNFKWCSSLIIWKTDKNKELIHARNLDYNINFLAWKSVIFNFLDNNFISVWFPWYIGVLTATNNNWITLSSHTSLSLDENKIWTPSWIVYRKIIEESKNIKDVDNILKNSNRTIANNLAISSLFENKLVVFEITSKNVIPRFWSGYVISTNHFESNELKINQISQNSKKRYDYLEKSYKENDNITVEKIEEVMSFYDWSTYWWSSVANKWTVQSVIFLPEKRKLYIAKWKETPVNKGWYIEYNY